MTRVLITGANGFIGRHVLKSNLVAQNEVVAAVRREHPDLPASKQVVIGSIGADTDWSHALAGVDVVIHLAARVHIMDESEDDPLAAFRSVNSEGTFQLAKQAAAAGVRRFIFLSSIKAMGEGKGEGAAYHASDQAEPVDPYGISKLEGEQLLQSIHDETGMEIGIIRPPLVYGRGVSGNFQRIVAFVKKGYPLPLAATRNSRAMISVGNLVSAISYHAFELADSRAISLVRDTHSPSTAELVRKIAHESGTQARLFSIPVSALKFGFKIIGRESEGSRLLDSLDVSLSSTSKQFAWKPDKNVEEADFHQAVVS